MYTYNIYLIMNYKKDLSTLIVSLFTPINTALLLTYLYETRFSYKDDLEIKFLSVTNVALYFINYIIILILCKDKYYHLLSDATIILTVLNLSIFNVLSSVLLLGIDKTIPIVTSTCLIVTYSTGLLYATAVIFCLYYYARLFC